MEATTEALREGDIFRWTYREPGDDRKWGCYHCCSCIAIVRDGRLRDTYWSWGHDGRSFGPADLPKLELKRIANLADLDPAKEYDACYYADADIVDLNHANSTGGNFYLRKGAKRSAEKMLQSALRNLKQAQSDERMAALRIERYQEAIARIEGGETDVFL